MTSKLLPDSTGIKLDDITLTKEQLQKFDKIYGCLRYGFSCVHGGQTCHRKAGKIPVEVEIASEFRYRNQ